MIGHRVYRDTDRLVTLFTRQRGKLVVIARGVRSWQSRRAGHLDLLTNAQVDLYQGNKWETITGANCNNAYSELRGSLLKLSAGFVIAEVLNRLLPERQEHAEAFDLTAAAIKNLADAPQSEVMSRLEVYMRMLLINLGYHQEAGRINQAVMASFVPVVEGLMERRLKSAKLLFAVC